MKSRTLIRLLITFISDEGTWAKFIDWIKDMGYTQNDIDIITKNL